MNGLNACFKEKKARKNKEKFYKHIRDIIYHVEDYNQKVLYEILFEKVLQNKKIQIIDEYSGKNDIVKKARDFVHSSDGAKNYFLLDKDYYSLFPDMIMPNVSDMSFNQIKSLENVIFLKRYSIENYLFSEPGIRKSLTIQGYSNSELESVDISLLMKKCLESTLEGAKLFLINNKYCLGSREKICILVDIETLTLKSDKVEEYKNIFNSSMLQEIDLLTITHKDIPGKEVLNLFKAKLRSLGLTKFNDAIFTRSLAEFIEDEGIDELREILVS